MYQVDINKRSTNKWSCKLCGEKQSLKQVVFFTDQFVIRRYFIRVYFLLILQVFFQGDSRDCRERVKALNELKNQNEQKSDQEKLYQHLNQSDQPAESLQESHNNFTSKNEYPERAKEFVKKESKWAKYLTNSDDENNYLF